MDCSTQIYNLGLSLKTPMKGVQVSLDGLKSSILFVCLFLLYQSIEEFNGIVKDQFDHFIYSSNGRK